MARGADKQIRKTLIRRIRNDLVAAPHSDAAFRMLLARGIEHRPCEGCAGGLREHAFYRAGAIGCPQFDPIG